VIFYTSETKVGIAAKLEKALEDPGLEPGPHNPPDHGRLRSRALYPMS